jgi:hypothetical protein
LNLEIRSAQMVMFCLRSTEDVEWIDAAVNNPLNGRSEVAWSCYRSTIGSRRSVL